MTSSGELDRMTILSVVKGPAVVPLVVGSSVSDTPAGETDGVTGVSDILTCGIVDVIL